MVKRAMVDSYSGLLPTWAWSSGLLGSKRDSAERLSPLEPLLAGLMGRVRQGKAPVRLPRQ